MSRDQALVLCELFLKRPSVLFCERVIRVCRTRVAASSGDLLIAFSALDRLQRDTAENHRQLRGIDLQRGLIACCARLLERAGFKPFVPDRQAIAVPIQDLDRIAFTIDEQEQAALGRLASEGLANDAGQSAEALPHVGGRGAEEDRLVCGHGRSSASSCVVDREFATLVAELCIFVHDGANDGLDDGRVIAGKFDTSASGE